MSKKRLWLAFFPAGLFLFSNVHAGMDAAASSSQLICEAGGRTAGAIAYEKQEAARTGLYSPGDGKQANPDLQARWAKYDYMNKVEQTLGTLWLSLAEDIYDKAKTAPDAQAARDIGYSVCIGKDAVPAISPKQIKRRGS